MKPPVGLGRKAACRGLVFGRRCYVPGETYAFEDLPDGTRADAGRQSADFEFAYGRPSERLDYAFRIMPHEELLELLRHEYGDRLDERLRAREVKHMADAIKREGLKHPPVGDEGWKRALALARLGMDLPYFAVVQPFLETFEPGIPTLEGGRMGDLRDVPLPPNIERPEMWTPEAVVQAVKDGFTFMLPFVMGDSFFTPNAYWIGGLQAAASGLTVGPEHTPEITLLPDRWIGVHTFFPPEMVSLPESRRAWVGEPNEFGVVRVKVEIDPDTIDWDLLNRGHQIRARRS